MLSFMKQQIQYAFTKNISITYHNYQTLNQFISIDLIESETLKLIFEFFHSALKLITLTFPFLFLKTLIYCFKITFSAIF